MDGVVVLEIGAKGAAVAGFDPATGETKWKTGDDAVAYQTPIPWKVDEILAAGMKQVFGIDPRTGKIVWQFEHDGGGGRGSSSMTPVPAGDDRILLPHKDDASMVIEVSRSNDKVDTKNKAENLVFQVEKQLEELPAEAPAEIKDGIQSKVDDVKEALKGDDLDKIKSTTETLEAAVTELYNAAQQAQAAAGGAGPMPDVQQAAPEAAEGESDEPKPAKGKVVDAEVVD